MLILNEENHKLKGTKHKLPPKVLEIFVDIIKKYPEYSHCTGYVKAKNAVEGSGIVTMEWLKAMKHFFSKHENLKDIEYNLAGGTIVKEYINSKLDQLTSSTPKTRKSHTNSPVKPLSPADNLSGHRGEKSSQALSMVNSLMSNIMPKFN